MRQELLLVFHVILYGHVETKNGLVGLATFDADPIVGSDGVRPVLFLRVFFVFVFDVHYIILFECLLLS